jgi:hypothetical protein
MKRCLPDDANGTRYSPTGQRAGCHGTGSGGNSWSGSEGSENDHGPSKRLLLGTTEEPPPASPPRNGHASLYASPPEERNDDDDDDDDSYLDYCRDPEEAAIFLAVQGSPVPRHRIQTGRHGEPHGFDPWPVQKEPSAHTDFHDEVNDDDDDEDEDDGLPPPSAPLIDAEDMARLWTSVKDAKERDSVHCMVCRAPMERAHWPTHMQRKHGGALLACPYALCEWKFASRKQGLQHILKHHDRRPLSCTECPALLFDRHSMLWRHECKEHQNRPLTAFHVNVGEEPLHEDDEGGAYLEPAVTDEEEEDEAGAGAQVYWDNSYHYHCHQWASVSWGRRAGPWSSNPGRTGRSRLGQCIVGRVPW